MNLGNYDYDGRCLRFEPRGSDEKVVEFRWPIAEVLAFDKCLVIRTSPDPGICENQNVHAVDFKGNVIWTVKNRKHVYEDSPYTKISIENGMLKLFNWDGLNLTVDPINWREVSAEYGR